MRFLSLLCLFMAGCAAASAAPSISEFDASEYRAAVAISAAQLDRPDVAPNKPARKDCKLCNGTGKVRSGDGLHVFDCTACVAPQGEAAVGVVEPLINAKHWDDLPFGEAAEFADRTVRTQQLCPCDTTGLCYCDQCTCPTKRTRVAYLYCTTNCPGCEKAKDTVIEAAKDGRLPADLRVVVRPNASDAPDWVRSFPTFHFAFNGNWFKTGDVNVFLRECNGIKQTAAPQTSYTPTVTYSTCGPGGCSMGSCSGGSCFGGSCSTGSFYGGGCSGGSCGRSGFSGYGGFFRGFSGGGGGCSSCGR